MALLSLTLPSIGENSATADQKVRDAFIAIQTGVNGNLDNTNLSATAAIALSKLGNKLLWGRVATAGTILTSGSGGWTATAGLAGIVTVNFSPNFASVPSVVALSESGNGAAVALNGAPTVAAAELRNFLTSSAALAAGNITFFAIG